MLVHSEHSDDLLLLRRDEEWPAGIDEITLPSRAIAGAIETGLCTDPTALRSDCFEELEQRIEIGGSATANTKGPHCCEPFVDPILGHC